MKINDLMALATAFSLGTLALAYVNKKNKQEECFESSTQNNTDEFVRTEPQVIYSRNGKLNTNMTRDGVEKASYDSEKARRKAISRFEKANKNGDEYLDAEEIKAYDRKQVWKTVGIVASSLVAAVALTAVGHQFLKPIIQRNRTLKGMMDKDLNLMVEENKSSAELEQTRARYKAIKRQFKHIRPKGTTMGLRTEVLENYHCFDADDRTFCEAILRHPKMGKIEFPISELSGKYWIDSLEKDLSGRTSETMANVYADYVTIGSQTKMKDVARFIKRNVTE